MASAATTALQMAIMAAATHYLLQPGPYNAAGSRAAEQAQLTFEQLSEHEATKVVIRAVETALKWLPQGTCPAEAQTKAVGERSTAPEGDTGPGVMANASFDMAEEPEAVERGRCNSNGQADDTSSSTKTNASASTPSSTSSEPSFHEPTNLYGPQASIQLPSLSDFELNQILDAIHKRRRARHDEMQRRVQCYRTVRPFGPEDSPKKKDKGKKTVRFTLDTKPGSVEGPSKPEDKMLSPLPAPSSSELVHFSAALASVPGNGSVFIRPNDFNEAELIRRLPAQMKNGAGGIAWCKGRTEKGLYLLDTPVRRILLDLKAGVGYDGSVGGDMRMMSAEEMVRCVLWGRGSVEEKWGGFKWSRALEEKGT